MLASHFVAGVPVHIARLVGFNKAVRPVAMAFLRERAQRNTPNATAPLMQESVGPSGFFPKEGAEKGKSEASPATLDIFGRDGAIATTACSS
mmetsp:Transcript_20825/g.41260  ORF Transcript_20825/g.41260 Transcript_20825/m.41260 type:complete len:92 (-) Transcript_20825:164-439(-)